MTVTSVTQRGSRFQRVRSLIVVVRSANQRCIFLCQLKSSARPQSSSQPGSVGSRSEPRLSEDSHIQGLSPHFRTLTSSATGVSSAQNIVTRVGCTGDRLGSPMRNGDYMIWTRDRCRRTSSSSKRCVVYVRWCPTRVQRLSGTHWHWRSKAIASGTFLKSIYVFPFRCGILSKAGWKSSFV